MDGDTPFNPPLGELATPVVVSDVAGVVDRLLDILRHLGPAELAGLTIDGGTGKRLGAPWFATVWVELGGDARAIMSPDTARKVASALASDRTASFHFGARGRLANRFTEAADQAERLAADANRKELN